MQIIKKHIFIAIAIVFLTALSSNKKMTNSILEMIDIFLNTDRASTVFINKMLGCNLIQGNNEDVLADLLPPDPDITSKEYSASKSTIYPQFERIYYKEFSSDILSENTVIINLKKESYIKLDDVIEKFGENYQFVTQSINVPEDQRCYAEYKLNKKTVIFSFNSCSTQKEIHEIIIRL